MNARQSNDLAVLKRVYDFVTSTPPAPPLAIPSPVLTQLVAQLQERITQAEDAASAQGSGNSKVTTSQRAALRRTLRTRYLIPIRHIARVLAKTTPGLDNIVQIPKKGASEVTLIAAAKAAVIDVTPYQAAFVSKGLAADFVAQLTAAIATVEQAADTNVAAKRQKLTATATLKSAISDGRDIVISIGHVVQTACDQDKVNGPATRIAWTHIQHVNNASAAPIPVIAPSLDPVHTTATSGASPTATPDVQ